MVELKHILGIDTSNYKTSLALISQETIKCDIRRFLEVKQGERGLRQSDALFQHIKNLPELAEQLNREYSGVIDAVAYSSAPRPVEGSYMPCFLAGESFARSVASFLNVPVISFSHQEGHIEAIKAFTEMRYIDDFIACHFSGGTCEVLKVSSREKTPDIIEGSGFCEIHGENLIYDLELIGGSMDISFGQVLDRAGVAMGFDFPCGSIMDEIAINTSSSSRMLTPIRVTDCSLNLSGIDTQIKNKLNALGKAVSVSAMDRQIQHELIKEIFQKISDAMTEMLIQASEKSGLKDIIMSGGVSTSSFIRQRISDTLEKEGIIVYFDELDLSSDNAVGAALLGSRYIWD